MQDDTPSDRAPGKRPTSKRAKPPLTIDLSATEVGTEPPVPPEPPVPLESSPVEPPASPPESAEPPAAPEVAAPLPPPGPPRPSPVRSAPPTQRDHPRAGAFGIVMAGIIGGLVALVVGIAIAAMGLLPSAGREAADAAAETVATLERRVASLEAAGSQTGANDFGPAIEQLHAAAKQMQARLDAIAAMPAGDGGAANAALAALAERIGKLEAAVAATSGISERIASLEASLAALTDKVAALAARPYGANESERAARAVAIGTLRQAAERGGAFVDDLAMLAALGSDEADIAALRPLAQKGAPSRAELAAAFPGVADAILVASTPADPESGLLGRIAGFARGLVTIRPTAPIAGDTPEAVVSRMQAAVDKGDLAAALAERKTLPDTGEAASAPWAGAAEARLAIDRLVGKLTNSVAPAGGG